MRHLIFLFILLFSSFCFAQNTGFIVGKVLDNEFNDAPLSFANISVKGTNIVSNSDLNGLFLIEYLEAGNYTLVCHFAGYETKEIEIKIISGTSTEVKIDLVAKTMSLAQLGPTISQKQDNKVTALN
jgi:hypothetical protein